MEYLMELAEGVTLKWALIIIAAVIFLWKVYREVEKYISKKAITEKEKDEQILQVINQAKLNQKWHQQSLDIREGLVKSIEGLRTDLEEIKKTSDDRHADDLRAYILRFNVELIREDKHTREDFIEVLAKIDEYEEYCHTHESYPNNRAGAAIRNVKACYDDRLQKHDFL